MARESRPPGFDMTYRPAQSRSFGPPPRAWLVPSVYFVISLAFLGVVATAHLHASDSWLFRYVVEGDAYRFVGARVLASIVFLGGLASVARTALQGVVVHPDGIEAKSVVGFGWPKVQNCTWAEIDEFLFEVGGVGLKLWDGSDLWLPDVANLEGLRRTLARVGAARAIPIKGKAALIEFDEEDE